MSQNVRDGKFCIFGCVSTRIRTYELSELAMKFELYIEGKVAKFEILSEDYRKLAIPRDVFRISRTLGILPQNTNS